jgi:thiol-disulfide isomerase/thioredoxin
MTGNNRQVTLLDFFSTWCGSCIAMLPRLDSLQANLGDSLRVLVVTAQPLAEIDPFLKARFPGHHFRFRLLVSDSLLSRYFPHRLLPHEVWLQDGHVKAITRAEQVSAANVRKLYQEKTISLPLKKELLDFDAGQSLSAYTQNTPLLMQSSLTGPLPGAGNSRLRSSMGSLIRRCWYNQPLLSLYQAATGLPFNRFLVQGIDPSLMDYRDPSLPLYCYEQLLPPGTPDSAARVAMLQDLDRLGLLHGSLETISVPCYVLVASGNPPSCLTRGGSKKVWTDTLAHLVHYRNVALSRILGGFDNFFTPGSNLLILLNESGITGNVDLTLPVGATEDLSRLMESLPSQGLRLIKQTRPLEMLVLRPVSTSTHALLQ